MVVYGLLPTLTVNPANATVAQGAAIPALTGTVSGLLPKDVLGTSVIVTYSTTATSASAPGSYPIKATVSGPSAPNYHTVVSAGTLTITAPAGGAPTPPPAPPTSISFGNGFSGSALRLNGSAQLSGTRLRLTSGGTYQAASAFFPTAQNVQGFTNDFTFQLTDAAADGFTMVIQDSSVAALGMYGASLGYGAATGT